MFDYVYYNIEEKVVDEIIEIVDSYKGTDHSYHTCTEKGFQTVNIVDMFSENLIKKIIPINELYKKVFHIHYIKYGKGGFQKEHLHEQDDYSFILYLNNSDGNTVLKNPVNKRIFPEKGKVIVFSGKILHYGEPSFRDKRILVGATN